MLFVVFKSILLLCSTNRFIAKSFNNVSRYIQILDIYSFNFYVYMNQRCLMVTYTKWYIHNTFCIISIYDTLNKYLNV